MTSTVWLLCFQILVMREVLALDILINLLLNVSFTFLTVFLTPSLCELIYVMSHFGLDRCTLKEYHNIGGTALIHFLAWN